MHKSHLLKYLLVSPNLPVGGFCYSEGLESFFDRSISFNNKLFKKILIIFIRMELQSMIAIIILKRKQFRIY